MIIQLREILYTDCQDNIYRCIALLQNLLLKVDLLSVAYANINKTHQNQGKID
jgi:hypothetical protein